jgi:sugar phosphate isomerase/epimerase
VRLGFFTACLPGLSLDDIAGWAAAHGYDALEVAAWPRAGDRGFTASHLDAATLGGDEAERVRALFDRHGLELSSLGYYDNNLHPDPAVRSATHQHLRACIDAAAALGCPTVGTFIGRDPGRTVAENLRDAEAVFAPLVAHGGERGVTLIIENCPMEGWHPDGYPGNLAYSPELWEWMFSLGLELNFDPSHLLWLGIDPVEAVRPYLDRIPHAQARTSRPTPDAATGTASSARRCGTTPGTRAGGATASPASARSTGGGWSTPCTRAASTARSRSSTRTRSGAATRSASRRGWRSPSAPSGP